MRKMLLGFFLSSFMCFCVAVMPSAFSSAYADDHATVKSEQMTQPVFVADNFDTVCAVDVAAKHEEDFLRDEQMASDVIVQSKRNLHSDSEFLLGLNNQYLQNQYRQSY
jgi:hypothetical protein